MIPCKDCISFALCNACEDRITCPILYKYFIEGGVPIENGDYPSPQSEKLEEISTFFDRKYDSWYFSGHGTLQDVTINWSKFPREMRVGEF